MEDTITLTNEQFTAIEEGQASKLHADSLVSCLNVGLVLQSKLKRSIGELSDDPMRQVDEAIKAAFSLP